MSSASTDRSATANHGHIPVAPVIPSGGRLRPLGLEEVSIKGGHWARRQRVNATATLAHIEHWLEREGWLPNFDLAASGDLPHGRRGREFSDSEVYKYLEAIAWQLGRADDPELEARFRTTVARVAVAQEPDGYLDTNFGRPGQGDRWSDLEWGHELYCAGHLFQAAVARERTRPGADDGLLGVATRVADLVCDVFGPDGVPSVCGHPEVETALVELGRVTGNRRYIDQAELFIERRGTGVLRDIEWGRSYYQDDIPVREADILRGHAVRANYLAAGAADVADETGDLELTDALRRQWSNTVARRTYITGGQGSHHQDEAFGEDFELPSDRAYSETCAGIASVQFSWRMLLADGDLAYADLIERTLYNVVATSPSAEGTAFYYANTLHRRTPAGAADPDAVSPRADASLRAPWFEVSCCPPNVARMLASLDAYVATVADDSLQLHQYAPARIRTVLGNGQVVDLAVATAYPENGRVVVTVDNDAADPWTLQLRVPSWASGASLTIDGETRDVSPGYADIRRAFHAGDVITLDLHVGPRFVHADPRIDAVRGSLAIERGPIVYALESVDLPVGWASVDDAILSAGVTPQDAEGRVVVRLSRRISVDGKWPYPNDPAGAFDEPVDVALVPYNEWAERGPSTMRIWIPEA